MARASLTHEDAAELEAHGLTEAEARRQIELLSDPPPPPRLARACTLGDGIETVTEARRDALEGLAREAAAAGRLQAFVPSSGAASRMFQDLVACRHRGGPITRDWLREAGEAGMPEALSFQALLDRLPEFAFHKALDAAIKDAGYSLAAILERGPLSALIDALLDWPGLGYDHLPKGLLLFHRTRDGARTPFQEHLVEADRLLRDEEGRCRLHFTVSPEDRPEWRRAVDAGLPPGARPAGTAFDVTFSEQSPATDTLALDEAGNPFRDGDGRLLFRPAGHGALIGNLHALRGDLVFVKNVDNVAHDDWKDPTWRWTRVIIGRLVEIEREVIARLDDLVAGAPEALENAIGFCRTAFLADPPEDLEAPQRLAWLKDRLDRPIRVCGVVPNTGEPGGGPFWVRGRDGARTIQIVEGAQVASDPELQRLFASGTHFNPVFLACALRRRDRTPHDLARFVDPRAVIVTEKTWSGRPLCALERPGLWNGAMAGWNTLLVEVPIGVFNPVKTVLDLLRAEHQPRAATGA